MIRRNIFSVLVIGILSFQSAFAKTYPKTEHYDGERFYNIDPIANIKKGLISILQWRLTGDRKEWPETVENKAKPNFPQKIEENEIYVTFVNHSTLVIQTSQLTVLTDPIFSERASPVSFAGPKRVRKSGVNIDELPKIDFVIISHNHYDHLDIDSVVALKNKFDPTFIVPLANAALLEEKGISKIFELDWWQTHKVNENNTIHLVPVQHWSARTPFDAFKSLWGGYVIESGKKKIYFAGDTGYNNHFVETYKRFGAMDVSLIPIGAYEPRWFMKIQHINPEEAVFAHMDLKSKKSIGIHFETFQLTDEGYLDPRQDLKKSLENLKINPDSFVAPEHGETMRIAL
jgi:L-ascorbate metabolism protein UlaG (beta-lactamase superfamily)